MHPEFEISWRFLFVLVLRKTGTPNVVPIAYYIVLEAISLFEADSSKRCIDKANAVFGLKQ